MNKEQIAKKYFLKGYKYAIELLSNEPNRDIFLDFYNEYLDKNDLV